MTERNCAFCGRVYLVPVRAGNAMRFCGYHCRREAGRLQEQRPTTRGERKFGSFQRTALNIETDRRFAACGGKHVPSGEYVIRDLERNDVGLPVCANCGVPYKGSYVAWNAKRKYDYDAEPAA